MNTLRKLLLLLFLTVMLMSCGGGGTSGTGVNNGENGGTTDGLSIGTITEFGSIFVNGVEFETTSANFSIDGVSGLSQDDLKIGMVVLVEGDINGASGTASNVIAEDILEGPVDQIIDSNTIIVMGQTVHIDTNTRFDNNVPDFAGIQTGNVLEISGHVKGNGIISASYIEKKTAAPFDYEVKGFVQNHDASLQSFSIGNLTVNYSTAITTDMPAPSGNNWNTLLVEVKGSVLAGGTLTATKVEPLSISQTTTISQVEIEGFVTAVTSGGTSFTVGNQLVQYSNSTIFEGGDPTEISVGTKLEAEGSLDNGVLNATRISFRDNVKIEADAEVVTSNTLTLSGLPGVTVTYDNLTEFKGSLSGLSDIMSGDHLRIRGREISGNTILATEIEDRSADSRVILQAPVDSFTSPNVVILGITVNTSSISANNFEDVDGAIITPTEFFNSLATGTLIKARGDLATGITWDQIELEE